jgi:predicted AAA+ superfamily ATPase
MFHRTLKPGERQSFFLFGPRGTGKSTLLQRLPFLKNALRIDLLNPEEEDRLIKRPMDLERQILALPRKKRWIILDEVQKVPRLLDVVHRLVESSPHLFALTGSSPRKLKRGASNLLAGRAVVRHLHPLTHEEQGETFRLVDSLRWGGLPKIFQLEGNEEKAAFLRSYALTYLKEEIAAEQAVRRLEPFRNFIEVAAQCNGQILNFSRVAEDVGVDVKTAQAYFGVLEDTLLGFTLPAHHRSIRKQQTTHSKFFLFDTGVKRALDRTLTQEILPRTYGFGAAFEHFIILEARRLNDYHNRDFRFSYLRTKDGAEVDLIVDRPGAGPALIEIKSTDHVTERDIKTVARFSSDFPRAELFCLSLDPTPKKIGPVWCLPWSSGLQKIV